MKQNMKNSALAIAVSAIALGSSGQANAEVYAAAQVFVTGLNVVILPNANGSAVVDNYTFNVISNATLEGAQQGGSVQCTQTAADCSGTAPVLTQLANGLGGTITRAAGDYALIGNVVGGSGETYSNSQAEIGEAALVTGNLTTTSAVAEVEIQGTGTGSANTSVSSNTEWTYDFSLAGGPGSVFIAFDATPYMMAKVDTLDATTFNAQSAITATFNLVGSNGEKVSWSPNGVTSGQSIFDFIACDMATCSENKDTVSLQNEESIPSVNPFTSTYDYNNVTGNYEILITGLAEGSYGLTFTTTTFATAGQAVPEPSLLALMGIGLAGLGFGLRRRKAV